MIALVFLASAIPGVSPEGESKLEITVDDRPLTVHVYKPASYRGGPMLMVFHGLGRDAEQYRDYSKPLADRRGLLVVAPRFDAERFPFEKYTRGGLMRDGHVAPRAEWTWSLVPGIAAALRA